MINKVTLIGRLGKDPEVRHFENNSSVCNFSVATGETYIDKEGKKIEQTEWHNVAIWRKGLVDVAEKYLKKGHLVYLEGKLRTRNWDDQNGNKRYTTEVVVDSFKMLEKRDESGEGFSNSSNNAYDNSSNQGNNTTTEVSNTNQTQEENTQDDDLPF